MSKLSTKQASTARRTEPQKLASGLRRRQYPPRPASLTDLPFVAVTLDAAGQERFSLWDVPVTEDYGQACRMGDQFAGDLIQYLKDNPVMAGSNIIGRMVEHMAAHPVGTAMHGYEVGFWCSLEVALGRFAAQHDHWAVIDMVQRQHGYLRDSSSKREAGHE